MPSGPHSGIEGVAADHPVFDAVGWQIVQSRFAEIIGANLHFILPQETFTCFSTHLNLSCSELTCCENFPPSIRCRCIEDAFRCGFLQGETIITCVHRLHYCVEPIRHKALSVGTLLIGPVILGKREPLNVYKKMCAEEGIDQERFLDRVRELSVFSFSKINAVLVFVKEMTKYAASSSLDSASVS